MNAGFLERRGWVVRVIAAGALAMSVCVAGVARAQESPAGDGISVAGSGEVKGKPNVIEINANVTGEAELAADAIVKYRDARRRGVEALNGLKIEGLKVESGGFAVNQGIDQAQAQAMMQGNAAPAGKSRVSVSEQLKVVLGGFEKLNDEELMDTVLKVLDTARDAGLQVGRPSPRNYYEMQSFYNNGGANAAGQLVSFKLSSSDTLREQAYKQAMDDAKKKAERLATLAGVKLGRIVAVKDAVALNTTGGPQAHAGLESGVFKEISVKVNLAVQFEIAK